MGRREGGRALPVSQVAAANPVALPDNYISTSADSHADVSFIAPHASPQPSPRSRSRTRTTLTYLALSLFFTSLGFAMAAAPAFETATALLTPPSDAETLTLFTPSSDTHAAIDSYILAHPFTQSLLTNPSYTASRPHLKIPPNMRPHHLTGGTLLGDDKIAVPPLTFTTADGSSFVSVQHLGHALCGHPGIVHGGLLATLLDEGLARCCFPALPHKVGVTASLKIDYRVPCKADQYVVLRAETTKVEGRKAWVKGRLETLADEARGEIPTVLVEAEALFIEPRQAAVSIFYYCPLPLSPKIQGVLSFLLGRGWLDWRGIVLT